MCGSQPRRAGEGSPPAAGRAASRALPEAHGELPIATLADEIETAGDGQIRAMFVIAGNPVLSAPNGERIERALASLDLLVSVDPSLNETSRLAHVVLPPMDAARAGHYDLAFTTLQLRNVARYSPPALPPDPGGMHESDILFHLIAILRGEGTGIDIAALADGLVLSHLERAAASDPRLADRRAEDLLDLIDHDRPAERLLDAMLRTGAYGDAFGRDPDGLTLAKVRDSVHGIDLGPLQPRLPEVLRTTSRAHRGHARSNCRRPRSPAREPRRAGAAHAPRRSPAPALEQLVDAQRPCPREGQAAMHAAGAPR